MLDYFLEKPTIGGDKCSSDTEYVHQLELLLEQEKLKTDELEAQNMLLYKQYKETKRNIKSTIKQTEKYKSDIMLKMLKAYKKSSSIQKLKITRTMTSISSIAMSNSQLNLRSVNLKRSN